MSSPSDQPAHTSDAHPEEPEFATNDTAGNQVSDEDYQNLYRNNSDKIADLIYQHLVNLVKTMCKEQCGYYLTPHKSDLETLRLHAIAAAKSLNDKTEVTIPPFPIPPSLMTFKRPLLELKVTLTRSFVLDLFTRGEVPPVEDSASGVRRLYPCIRRGCTHWRPEDDENIWGLSASHSVFKPETSDSDGCLVCSFPLKATDYADRRGDEGTLRRLREWQQDTREHGSAESNQREIDEILLDQQMYLRSEPVYVTLADLSSNPLVEPSRNP